MKIDVNCLELKDKFAAAVTVDGEIVHTVSGYSRIGVLAALASACEADLDEAMAIHTAVKASLQDTAVREQRKNVSDTMELLGRLEDDKDDSN